MVSIKSIEDLNKKMDEIGQPHPVFDNEPIEVIATNVTGAIKEIETHYGIIHILIIADETGRAEVPIRFGSTNKKRFNIGRFRVIRDYETVYNKYKGNKSERIFAY